MPTTTPLESHCACALGLRVVVVMVVDVVVGVVCRCVLTLSGRRGVATHLHVFDGHVPLLHVSVHL